MSLLRQDRSVKIICVGRNYAEHASELGNELPAEPLLFGKFPNTLIGPGDPIVLPREATHVDAEAELAVEIGRSGRRVHRDDALDLVRGYLCANDVSARNLQYADGQWTRAKGFDTFCPLGPVIETEFDAASATLQTRVNGEVRQDGRVSDLVHSIAAIVEYASSVWTLLPGDVILTGTPAGVGPIADGDTVEG